MSETPTGVRTPFLAINPLITIDPVGIQSAVVGEIGPALSRSVEVSPESRQLVVNRRRVFIVPTSGVKESDVFEFCVDGRHRHCYCLIENRR